MRWLAVPFALTVGGLVGAVDVAPQAIRAPLPTTPWEAGAMPTLPTATVELKVSPRGVVTSVVVTALHPSTSAEHAFRKAIEETLGTWRYAPAIRDGKPADAVLSMQIQFSRPDSERGDNGPVPGYAIGFADAEDPLAAAWEWRIDTLDQAAFLDVRKQAIATADALIPAKRRREEFAQHFQVVTDASIPDLPKAIARNLEAVFANLGPMFENVGTFAKPRAPLTAYVFELGDTFRRFAIAFGPPPEAAGLYLSLGVLLFHLEMPDSESLRKVLVHETTHAFVDRYLVRRGVQLPTWLAEGLAEYVGNSDVDRGQLKPGNHKAYAIHHIGTFAWRDRSTSWVDADMVKTAIKSGSSIKVSKLLGTSASRFYGKDIQLYYSQSWLLVHFLRHGRPGWSEKQFPAFLLYSAEGFPIEDTMTQVYALEGEALEKAYRDYVLKF